MAPDRPYVLQRLLVKREGILAAEPFQRGPAPVKLDWGLLGRCEGLIDTARQADFRHAPLGVLVEKRAHGARNDRLLVHPGKAPRCPVPGLFQQLGVGLLVVYAGDRNASESAHGTVPAAFGPDGRPCGSRAGDLLFACFVAFPPELMEDEINLG